MENQASMSEKYSLIPILSQPVEILSDPAGNTREDRNKLALEAYLIMDQGHDLQTWFESRLHEMSAH
jgi:hypothetical protein